MVQQVFSGAFEDAMRWCAWAVVEAGYCVLVDARLCSIQPILSHSWCGSMQDRCLLATALDLAAAALCIELGVEAS